MVAEKSVSTMRKILYQLPPLCATGQQRGPAHRRFEQAQPRPSVAMSAEPGGTSINTNLSLSRGHLCCQVCMPKEHGGHPPKKFS